MSLFNNEAKVVEKIYAGNDKAFTDLYEKFRGKFFGYFQEKCIEERFANQVLMKFKRNGMYLDDLYQTTCLKFYNQIMTGKLFSSDGKIYIIDKNGNINLLQAKLETYLIGIGTLSLKEFEREECRFVDFDPIEKIGKGDYDSEYDLDNFIQPITTSKVDIDPVFEISSDPFFNNEDAFALVRQIVGNMESPCKEIFTYTYFNENGKKLKGEEIAQLMGYASADVVKNQKSRCHKKFKATYIQRLSSIQ